MDNRRRFNPHSMALLSAALISNAFGLPEDRHYPQRRRGRVGEFKNKPRKASTSKYKPHQGAKECAKRRQQMERERLRAAA